MRTWMAKAATLVIALSPLSILSTIGWADRSRPDILQSLESTAEENSAISAYTVPVRIAYSHGLQRNYEGGAPKLSNEVVDSVGASWISAFRRGKLKNLESTFLGDSSLVGVKSEIIEVRSMLAETTRAAARRDQASVSAGRLATAIEISAIAKYSDFRSVSNACATQTRAAKALIDLVPSVSPRQAKKLERQLAIAAPPRNRVAEMLRHERKLYEFFTNQTSRSNVSHRTADRLELLAQILEKPEATQRLLKRSASIVLAEKNELAQLCSHARSAWRVDCEYRLLFGELLSALRDRSN